MQIIQMFFLCAEEANFNTTSIFFSFKIKIFIYANIQHGFFYVCKSKFKIVKLCIQQHMHFAVELEILKLFIKIVIKC